MSRIENKSSNQSVIPRTTLDLLLFVIIYEGVGAHGERKVPGGYVFLQNVPAAQKRFRAFGRHYSCGVARFEHKRTGMREAATEPAPRKFSQASLPSLVINESEMVTRTTSRTVTFRRPFALDGFARELPAGTYLLETDEELMDMVLSTAWRRVSTMIRMQTGAGTKDIFIDPEQLNAALLRDLALPNTSSETAATATACANRTRDLIADRTRKT